MPDERPATILVVDDTEANRYTIARLLRREGIGVLEAATGRSGLERAREAQPDLVLLDVRLPDISGFEVCRLLREDPATRSIPVILLSASFTDSASRVRGLEGGADAYITHPVDPPVLTATVRAMLRARRAETALRASENRYRSLFESIDEGFCVVQVLVDAEERPVDYRFLETNPAFLRQTGLADAVGRTMRELAPAHEAHWFDTYGRVARTGEPIRFEAPAEALGRWYDVYAFRVGEPSQRRVAILFHDITERRRQEAALEHSRGQLLTVLEQAPLAVAILGPAGEIRFRNPIFDRLWGRVAADASAERDGGSLVGYHLDGRRLAAHEWPGARAVLRGEVVEGEVLQIEQPGGHRRTIWTNAAPVLDPAGQITGAVVMSRDVTVERRTEEQLREAQRLHAVGTLAGGVAHEVNNALQGALGFGEFVLRALGPDHPQSADMQLVLQAVERATRVSQQLLAYTRQQVSRPRAVDLAALVRGLRPVLRQLLGADRLLELQLPETAPPPIHADPGQVEQILINLAANARDATGTGGRVTVAVAAVEGAAADTAGMGFTLPPGAYVRLAVEDTGAGMDDATRARIFDPFFTTKAVGEGTGLGLSMVYGIVKQHGGYVGARSAPGRGTTMELYWPVARAAAPARRTPAHPSADARAAGRGRAVLVAEDEPVVRALVVRTLEEAGYTVLAAEDGAAALALLETRGARPDLLVTDVIMPRLNGRELADAVAERWGGVPMLFISGHTGEEAVLQRLIPAGAPFLQKPFSPDALVEAVAAGLARGGASRS